MTHFTRARRATLDDSVRVTGDGVAILDRRVFPERTEWVLASTAEDVAAAIRGMVTQSSGPLYATYAALEVEAQRLRAAGASADEVRARIRDAGAVLVAARPTNGHPRHAVQRVLAALDALGPDASSQTLTDAVIGQAREGEAEYRALSAALGAHAAELLPDGARVLTHCWMDSYLLELVHAADALGRRYEWVATETRPYLQGARLTAHSLAELGHHVTLVTDGMAAAALAPGAALGRIDALVTAADRVPLDGSVVNKVGTLGLAIAAAHFGVPFHALVQHPDASAATASDVVVEQRDPLEVLEVLGRRSASPLVERAWYPAFDVTPPSLVTSIVTSDGVFAPDAVAARYGIPA